MPDLSPIYRELPPPPALAGRVECFWHMEAEGSGAPPERILPDGCSELIFNLADPFRRVDAAGREELQPALLLAGPSDRPVSVGPTGCVRLVGVRFQPGGLATLLDVPPDELTGRVLPVDDVSTGLAAHLSEILDGFDAGTTLDRLGHLLVRRALDAGRDRLVEAAVRAILRSRGSRSVDAIASAVGVGPRQLERRFAARVGIGPKLLARITRFQAVFQAIEREDSDGWAAVALDCGYYDQAHLIRDFRRFAGVTPAVVREAEGPLTRAFLRRNRVSGFSNPPV